MIDKHHAENLEYANQNLKKDLKIALEQIENLKKENNYLKSNKAVIEPRGIKKLDLVEEIFEIFDEDFYLEENQDIKKAGINPFEHFIKFGYKEGRLFFKNISEETEMKIIKDFNN